MAPDVGRSPGGPDLGAPQAPNDPPVQKDPETTKPDDDDTGKDLQGDTTHVPSAPGPSAPITFSDEGGGGGFGRGADLRGDGARDPLDFGSGAKGGAADRAAGDHIEDKGAGDDASAGRWFADDPKGIDHTDAVRGDGGLSHDGFDDAGDGLGGHDALDDLDHHDGHHDDAGLHDGGVDHDAGGLAEAADPHDGGGEILGG